MVSQSSRGAMFAAVFVALCVALLALQKGHVDSAPSFDADLTARTQRQPPASTQAGGKWTPRPPPTFGAEGAEAEPTSAAVERTPSSAPASSSSLDGVLELRLPQAPIFRDYPAYLWPLCENMTSEVVTRSSLVTAADPFVGDSQLPRPRSVDLDYPCHVEHSPPRDLREFQGRPPVKLYVPWPSPKSNTQVPLDDAKCPVDCRVTSETSAIPTVDGFVVDSNGALINEKYDWPRNPLRKRLVFFNTENVEGRRSVLKRGYGLRYLAKPYNHTLWSQFHLVVSYHWHSPVRLSFAEWASCRVDDLSRTMALLRSSGGAASQVKKDASLAPVLFFARNCDFVMHKRQGFVRKLREHIGVDAVGKCLNSREQTSIQRCQRGALNGLKNKRPCIISQYRFYLAVENSVSLDYVTEKVYEPLFMGTIPVYLGAPNIVNFLPAPHSAIIAADFRTMADLARYLKCVMRNETLYAYYTAWRERPRLAPFDALQRQYAPLCQVCMAIDRDKRRSSTPPPVGSVRPPASDGALASLIDSQAPLWNSCPTKGQAEH